MNKHCEIKTITNKILNRYIYFLVIIITNTFYPSFTAEHKFSTYFALKYIPEPLTAIDSSQQVSNYPILCSIAIQPLVYTGSPHENHFSSVARIMQYPPLFKLAYPSGYISHFGSSTVIHNYYVHKNK